MEPANRKLVCRRRDAVFQSTPSEIVLEESFQLPGSSNSLTDMSQQVPTCPESNSQTNREPFTGSFYLLSFDSVSQ